MKTLKLRTIALLILMATILSLVISCASTAGRGASTDGSREPQNGFVLWRRAL
jgi:hypothetical protein